MFNIRCMLQSLFSKKMSASDKATNYFINALRLETSNKYKEAVASYDEALKYRTDDYNIYLAKAYALAFLCKHRDALSTLDMATKYYYCDKNNRATKNTNTQLCQIEYCDDDSILTYHQELKNALSTYPNTQDYSIKEKALNRLKAYLNSMTLYDDVIQNDPNNEGIHEAYLYKGLLLEEYKKYEEAIKYCDMSIKHRPNYRAAQETKERLLAKLEEQM